MYRYKIKNRYVFRELAFELQIATGDRANEIIEEMLEIIKHETDVNELHDMKRTLLANSEIKMEDVA